jgi:hypothetical protein
MASLPPGVTVVVPASLAAPYAATSPATRNLPRVDMTHAAAIGYPGQCMAHPARAHATSVSQPGLAKSAGCGCAGNGNSGKTRATANNALPGRGAGLAPRPRLAAQRYPTVRSRKGAWGSSLSSGMSRQLLGPKITLPNPSWTVPLPARGSFGNITPFSGGSDCPCGVFPTTVRLPALDGDCLNEAFDAAESATDRPEMPTDPAVPFSVVSEWIAFDMAWGEEFTDYLTTTARCRHLLGSEYGQLFQHAVSAPFDLYPNGGDVPYTIANFGGRGRLVAGPSGDYDLPIDFCRPCPPLTPFAPEDPRIRALESARGRRNPRPRRCRRPECIGPNCSLCCFFQELDPDRQRECNADCCGSYR